MKLHSLALEDFRGFEREEITFEPDLTVLVGANGSGKTSVLDAVIAARAAVDSGTNLRHGADEGRVRLAYDLGDGGANPCSELTLTRSGPNEVRHKRVVFERGGVQEVGPDRPIFVFRADRRAKDLTPASTKPERWLRKHAVRGWTDALGSAELFFHWFKERDDAENESIRYEGGAPLPELTCVRDAVTRLFPDVSQLRVRRDFRPYSGTPVLSVVKGGVPLPFDALSDGERTWILLVADLARRLALWDLTSPEPRGADLLATEATVLIDEIEQHIHPAWQRRLLGKLGEVFPNVQFIVTTHSPVVVSEVEPRQLRVLRDFKLVPNHHMPGQDVSAVLEGTFDTPKRNAEAEAGLERLADMVDDGDPVQAMAYARQLVDDHVVDELDEDLVYYRVLLQRILASSAQRHPPNAKATG